MIDKKQTKVYIYIFVIFLLLGIILDLVLIGYKEQIVKRDIESKVHLVASFVINVDNRKGIDALDHVYNSHFGKHFINYLIDKDGFEFFMDPYVYGKPDLSEFIKEKYFDYKIYEPSTKYMIVIRVFSTPDDFEFGDLIYSKFLKMNITEHLNNVYTNKILLAHEYLEKSKYLNTDQKREEKVENLLTEQVFELLSKQKNINSEEYSMLLHFNEFLGNLRLRKDSLNEKNKPVLELGKEEIITNEFKVLEQKEQYLNIDFSDLKYNKFQGRVFKTFPIITLIFIFLSLFTILIINIVVYKKR